MNLEFNPRSVLQERYPSANLSAYFFHLARSSAAAGQEHHICPKKQFPEFRSEPANLIMLSVEDHKQAHRLLAAAVPELSLAHDAWAEAASKGGRMSKESKKGWFAPGSAAKGGSIGGSISGPRVAAQHKKNGTGVYALKMQQLGSHKRWHSNRGVVNEKCALCLEEVTGLQR